MSKKTKGQEFIDSFEAGDNQETYDLLKEILGLSSRESYEKLINNESIKMKWQDEDN
jgi:hypothetical protein